MKAITKRCPNITDLSLFPLVPYFGKSTSDEEDYSDTSAESDALDNAKDGFGANRNSKRLVRFHKYFKQTHTLQNLITTSFVIDSRAIEILASFPGLTQLVLDCRSPGEDLDYQLSPKYPKSSFRSLSTLELLFPDMECISRIWGLLPLVNRLTDVTIELRDGHANSRDYDSDDELPYARNLISFIPELCKRSPGIQRLAIDFDADDVYQQEVVSLEALRSLAALPLYTLDLRHARLEKSSNNAVPCVIYIYKTKGLGTST
ncbi:hypothetical protein FRC07_013713 [Ceratobasidium sp. 392]|nr:hypothetical protein FRC07_013713 [Ceratobasidium sp. 392]